MTQFYIRLIGGLRVFDDHGRSVKIKGRKISALLAVLASNPGRSMSRDELAEMLWGEGTNGSALANLRQTLARLRSQLPDRGGGLVISSSDALAVSAGNVSIDLEVLEEAIRDGGAPELEKAATLCDGEFLDGLKVASPEFEHWLSAQRQRVTDLKIDLLSRMLAHQVAAADFRAALTTGNRLLELDPCDEFAHRTLMNVYLAMGRRSAALRQYGLCAETLRRELRTSPEPATDTLRRAIASHTVFAAPRIAPASHAVIIQHSSGVSKMTEQTMRVLMAVDHHAGDFADRLLSIVNQNGGRFLGRVNGAMIAMFPSISAATTCAELLQRKQAWRERVAVSVGPVAVQSPPLHGDGVDVAMSLLNATGTGEIAISPIANRPPVHRIRVADADSPGAPEKSEPLFAALQWAALIGYFGFWMSMITYSVYHLSVHKTHLCWPEFLCG